MNAAMKEGDFAVIRQIAIDLGVKNVPPMAEFSPPPKQSKPNAPPPPPHRQTSTVQEQPLATGGDNAGKMLPLIFWVSCFVIVSVAALTGTFDDSAPSLPAVQSVPAPSPSSAKPDPSSFCPLCNLAYQGNIAEIKRLLATGANPNMVDSGGATPLMFAVQEERLDVVKALLGAGANPNMANDYGVKALDIAIAHGHAEVIRVLQAAGANL